MSIFRDLLELFYPSLCVSCHKGLMDQEKFLCLSCLYALPRTNHLNESSNKLELLFHDKIGIVGIASFAYFSKEGIIQKIIHEIKYKNNRKLGFYLGQICGNELKNKQFVESIDFIVPIPLHPNRLKKRGFNQALVIAEGISQKLNIPILNNNLIRIIDNPSQTAKSKKDRWINSQHIFSIKEKCLFEKKHLLLIDDIITTGSTLVECSKLILECNNTRVSIYTVALAI